VGQLEPRFQGEGVASEQLVGECGRTVVACYATSWSTTYTMCKRLLEVKDAVNTLNFIAADGLPASEWARLEELMVLLEPFYTQTNVLCTTN